MSAPMSWSSQFIMKMDDVVATDTGTWEVKDVGSITLSVVNQYSDYVPLSDLEVEVTMEEVLGPMVPKRRIEHPRQTTFLEDANWTLE